jgi:hypothetical protein
MSKYLQDEIEKKFDHLVEECGEFLAAYGKMRRWGAFSYNPEVHPDEREPNIDWVWREVVDIRDAVARLIHTNHSDNEINEAFPLYND